MFVAEVVGNVWGQYKHPSLDGKRLLLVRAIDPISGAHTGDIQMAVEGGVGAGPGSVVIVMDEGGSARQILKDDKAPVRAVVCAIVDKISMGGKEKHYA
ncbi:MAG TPA: EutN/CcmL family microcompartment protein [Elusimicrobiota bacterium]|jgi:microcompartment protein CcmK/EutM|nr:EutN/CcmL family microcompartment protein [Elusimicrobiota bacterium]